VAADQEVGGAPDVESEITYRYHIPGSPMVSIAYRGLPTVSYPAGWNCGGWLTQAR
jgi:hypothetical protein